MLNHRGTKNKYLFKVNIFFILKNTTAFCGYQEASPFQNSIDILIIRITMTYNSADMVEDTQMVWVLKNKSDHYIGEACKRRKQPNVKCIGTGNRSEINKANNATIYPKEKSYYMIFLHNRRTISMQSVHFSIITMYKSLFSS